ncbi:hypothetical protein ND444_07430 [Yersinia ruckeri]|nr:hypothetical protein [Yersinia ruckeri]UZX96192.1 hypothetical protein ND444_07430 [Yersinia ruckeri]
MGVQGLADGFLAGFNTTDQAVSRNRELGLRDAAQQQQIKDSDRNYGLAQEQVNWRRETDSRDFERQSGRDKEDDRRFGLRNALDQQ